MDHLTRFRELLLPVFSLDSIEEIPPEASLVADLGADSLDFVEIVYMVEKEFSVKLSTKTIYLEGRELRTDEMFLEGVLDPGKVEGLREMLPRYADKIRPGMGRAELFGLVTVRTWPRWCASGSRPSHERALRKEDPGHGRHGVSGRGDLPAGHGAGCAGGLHLDAKRRQGPGPGLGDSRSHRPGGRCVRSGSRGKRRERGGRGLRGIGRGGQQRGHEPGVAAAAAGRGRHRSGGGREPERSPARDALGGAPHDPKRRRIGGVDGVHRGPQTAGRSVTYAMTKAGLSGMAKALASELKRFSIRVNNVVPGMVDGGIARGIPDEHRKAFLSHCAAGRAGTALEIAEVVCFLLSDRSSYINAQDIAVDGGF
ncbi:MAG: SDR family oxidoreductase [Fibrobacteres bacterium]|nr:SDR family oxidoreductase [Fibrobacterota bacterium]